MSTRVWHPWTAALALVGVSLGCNADDSLNDAVVLSAPSATRSSVNWYDETHDELIVASPGPDALDLRRIAIGDETTTMLWCQPTVDGDATLMLLVPASEKQEDVGERLVIVPDDDADDFAEVDVLAPFTSVALSPDGRLAVLYFGTASSGGGLHNANQVAIVDLQTLAVRNLTLNGFGGALSSVHFTRHETPGAEPTVQVGARSREVLAFLAEGEVVLVDAADPTADQVSVTFRDAAGFAPTATMLRAGNDMFDAPVLFLRGEGGSDVAMLTLVDKADEATGTPGFSAQVSLVPIGATAADFTTYDGIEAPYLITVDPGQGSLVFTDIRTQQGFEVALPGIADRVLLRDLLTETGAVKQAVAWAQGGIALHTLRLDGVEMALGRAPERLDIETGIDEVVMLDNDRALVGSGSLLYVVDFEQRQVTPLRSQVNYDPGTSALNEGQMLLGTPGQRWISSVDLQTLNPESMVLDDDIARFFHLPDAGKLVVVHAGGAGHLTVADDSNPSRATSYSVWGITLQDALRRASEDN